MSAAWSPTPDVALYELLANHQSTLDAYQGGSEDQTWTVTGSTADGPFTLQAGNRYTDTQDITFTANVTANAPGSGTLGGSVTFSEGTTTLATVSLSNGSASYTTSDIVAEFHAINAAFAGDSNFRTSSSSINQTVSRADTSTVVTPSANPSVFG